MTGKRDGRFGPALLTALAAGLLLTGPASAGNPNEHEVKPQRNVQDGDDITAPGSKVWALDFKFKGPRLITVDVPGRGQKVCWYLWYQVTNNTREPHTFIPDFELVTHDKKTVHKDQILPKVQEAIRQIEDPTNHYKVKNSVTISQEPIPPTRPNAAPRPVTGVAIWDDVDPDSNNYSIFVSGLSNGYSVTDPVLPGGKSVVRRKTLELKFQRLGDRYYQRSEEIRFLAPARWLYRGSELQVPGLSSPAAAAKENK